MRFPRRQSSLNARAGSEFVVAARTHEVGLHRKYGKSRPSGPNSFIHGSCETHLADQSVPTGVPTEKMFTDATSVYAQR